MPKINVIKLDQEHGAKLHKNGDCQKWVVLDQPDNDLWNKFFKTKKEAALAFIHEKRLSKLLYY